MRKLTGGKTISVDPARLQLPLYGDAPKIRVGAPGTWQGNVATGVQMVECAKQKLGQPEVAWVKVLFREVTGEHFLVASPVEPPVDPIKREPDTYQVKFSTEAKAPIIRGLKVLFEAARVELRDDTWYDMPTEIAQDEVLGLCVCASWTKASLKPRTDGESEAAAGKQ